MKKIGIFYGSSTGTTQGIAETIASKLGVPASDVIDVSKMNADMVKEYEALLLGTSTWGDSESYCDTFCDGMGIIYEDIKDSGCTIVGKVSAKDYSFSSSIAVIDGMFVGLALDDINESDKTEERIDAWVNDIKNHLA